MSTSGIGLGGELALPRVAAGLRIERVEANTVGGELLIDCEEGRTLRGALVGMLREADREPERLGGRVLRHLSAM